MEFHYYLPVNLLFGSGKFEQLGKETARYGTRALIVTGQGSTKKTGLLDRAIALLTEAGLSPVVFDQVTPNPVTSTVYAGVRLAKEEGCDVLVALGGGSIIDCAKSIAFACCNDGDIFDYIYGIRTGTRALPLVAVPTTCGTGSEGNCFAVLTNPETNDKKSLRNIASVPKASIIDPELMVTMPDHVAASVMFDALCHSIEAYIAKTTQPLVEMQALYAVRLLGAYLLPAYRDHSNLEAWNAVTLASTLGGMCIHTAGVAAPHGLEHPASGLRNIVHGRGLAALSPVIYRETVSYAPDKFDELSRLLGGSSAADFCGCLDELLAAIDLKTTLRKEGLTEADVPWMTENCFRVSSPALNAHPRTFTKEEVAELYYKAL